MAGDPVKARRSCEDPACDEAWHIYRNAPLRVQPTSLVNGVDDTRPYGDVSHINWKAQERFRLDIADLTLSQYHVSTLGLLRFVEGRKHRDVQVVHYEGRLYLHNGHHRVIYRAVTGKTWVWARVAELDKPVLPHRWSADRA